MSDSSIKAKARGLCGTGQGTEDTRGPNIKVITNNNIFQVLISRATKSRFTRYDFVACDNGLRQAHDMIYDCCVRQKKCRSILTHVLKRRDNRKSCRRPVASLSHTTKSYRVNRP